MHLRKDLSVNLSCFKIKDCRLKMLLSKIPNCLLVNNKLLNCKIFVTFVTSFTQHAKMVLSNALCYNDIFPDIRQSLISPILSCCIASQILVLLFPPIILTCIVSKILSKTVIFPTFLLLVAIYGEKISKTPWIIINLLYLA
ncbi:unnamed protein product [Moneuplotes crassus]|uniref:Uncharacterized protein n=1 Tax=Euplotes crassus TaxID=5936 RepID=A0AAD2D2X8_EUPCR|nr:unnamed protein product [Moneuplotes crassus]